jgi:NAD(P)-dependent dehydrogenase (short-subunit alcohol dehydrogenase family)
MKVANKVIVVTGGGSGIGRELVRQLLERGASVAAVDISPAALHKTAASAGSHGARLAALGADVADRASVEALPNRVLARFGSVDGVIHCAGVIHPFARVHELEWPAIERVLAVNLGGTLHVMRAFLPHLLARPEAHVVTVSSMGGFVPVPLQSIYCASKAAVKLLTEALHSELAHTRVKVSVVLPGHIETDITTNSGIELPVLAADSKLKAHKGGPADKAAAQILQGMERDAYRILVGSDAKFMDAFHRFSPRRAAAAIARQMSELLQS